jgi:hypothetical protein
MKTLILIAPFGFAQIDLPIHRTLRGMERQDHREPDAVQLVGRDVDPVGDVHFRLCPSGLGHAEVEGWGSGSYGLRQSYT